MIKIQIESIYGSVLFDGSPLYEFKAKVIEGNAYETFFHPESRMNYYLVNEEEYKNNFSKKPIKEEKEIEDKKETTEKYMFLEL